MCLCVSVSSEAVLKIISGVPQVEALHRASGCEPGVVATMGTLSSEFGYNIQVMTGCGG